MLDLSTCNVAACLLSQADLDRDDIHRPHFHQLHAFASEISNRPHGIGHDLPPRAKVRLPNDIAALKAPLLAQNEVVEGPCVRFSLWSM